MLNLRIDVDYAYSSRIKSVNKILFNFPSSNKNYLKNACVIAEKINASALDVKAYWFFNIKTLPSQHLLSLLDSSRHEIGLHVINDAAKELEILQRFIAHKIKYYSIHGTESLFGQILWGRRPGLKQAFVSVDFCLKSIHSLPCYPLDSLCFSSNVETATKQAKKYAETCVLSLHPEWLFESNNKNRGPFYRVLLNLLEVSPNIQPNTGPEYMAACGCDYGYMEDEIHGC